MAKKVEKKSSYGYVVAVLISLFILAYLVSGLFSLFMGGSITSGNVAVVQINGFISTSEGGSFSDYASSTQIVWDIEDAASNPAIKAIILEINSPGGQPVATDEIATAVKRANKTTVAWIREMGASGAYWIASSTDYIIANRMSITGSIGVIGSYLDFSGFIDDWNISYERLVAGKYKDAGTPLRALEPSEKIMLQTKLDLLHDEFRKEVKNNRKLSDKQIKEVSEGEFYLGMEAKNLGLVDELGGKREAIDYIEKNLNITAELAVYKHEASLLERLAGMVNYNGFSLGNSLEKGSIATLS